LLDRGLDDSIVFIAAGNLLSPSRRGSQKRENRQQTGKQKTPQAKS
jgi:hypothetical protein